MIIALLIFIATLTLVIVQPRGLGIGTAAWLGAGVALLLGIVSWHDIPVVWHIVWDATFTLIALILISLILDAAGLFEWAALHIARWAAGRGKLLFILIVLLGAVIAALFANDGAVLILTPLVIEILHALRFTPLRPCWRLLWRRVSLPIRPACRSKSPTSSILLPLIMLG